MALPTISWLKPLLCAYRGFVEFLAATSAEGALGLVRCVARALPSSYPSTYAWPRLSLRLRQLLILLSRLFQRSLLRDLFGLLQTLLRGNVLHFGDAGICVEHRLFAQAVRCMHYSDVIVVDADMIGLSDGRV